jgi:hypothetical protein
MNAFQNEELLYRMPGSLLFVLLAFFLMVSIAAGYRIGLRHQTGMSDADRSQIFAIQGSLLGLLALLLGFTFAMTVSRFDTRKQLVLDEANAIGTAYLRTRLLPEPFAAHAARLLRNYVDVRLKFYSAGVDQLKLNSVNDETERIQSALWSNAEAAAKSDIRAVPTGLFIESLNEVIDLHAKRVTALENHVPESILFLLTAVALLSLGITGYGCGLAGRPHYVVMTVMAVLIAAVMYLISDLDRPRRGLIRVSQQSMLTLQESIGKSFPGH